ncbi:MAG: amidase [Thermomicrobiales bacterium]
MDSLSRDIAFLSIAELVDELEQGSLSSVDVTRAQLARIEDHDEALNAYITVLAEAALEQAAAADRARSEGRSGPLLGVPIALKDLFHTAGVRTTAGSKVLADWVPDSDGTVVRLLDAAGAVTLGKTNMMEFAYGYPHRITASPAIPGRSIARPAALAAVRLPRSRLVWLMPGWGAIPAARSAVRRPTRRSSG